MNKFLGALFAVALLLRLLFWSATSDQSWAYGLGYKGDAALWWQYAQAIAAGQPETFELGLPLRPPGNAYLLAAFTSIFGHSLLVMRLVYVCLGACLAPVLFLVLRKPFGTGPSGIAAALCAASSSLMLLSNSLDAETPYLLLSIASLWRIGDLRRAPGRLHLLLWSVAQGLTCLLRAEHLLFVMLMLVWLGLGWSRRARAWPWVLTSLFAFAVTITPWQVTAYQRIAAFNNTQTAALPPAGIAWSADARAALMDLPAFCRASVQGFVSACVRQRGGRRVTADDLQIIDQAYGYRPEPLNPLPFVALYGPLNFYLSNNSLAAPGFSPAALQQAPQLEGGAARYDPLWLRNLPLDGRLAFEYPPHLRLINHGLSLGLDWVFAHPLDYLSLTWQRMIRFWAGAAQGYGGYAQPLGLSGRRDPVDMLRAEGFWQLSYAAVILVIAGLGLASLRRRPELWPVVLWIVSKLAITIGFYGYARQGALIVPAVCILLAVACWDRLLPRLSGPAVSRLKLLAAGLCVWLVLSEAWRWLAPPKIWIDGQAVHNADPWPVEVHRPRQIEFR